MNNQSVKENPWLTPILICMSLILAALILSRIFFPPPATELGAPVQMPCTANQNISILKNGVIYSDGTTIRALNEKGRQIWSHVVGANCGYNVGEGGVTGWDAGSIELIDAGTGQSVYSINEPNKKILSAYAGTRFTAVLTGSEHDSELMLIDRSGQKIETIPFPNQMVLDYGFFNSGNMLWVMALDTNSTVPTSYITTYKPGRTQAGSVSDSEQVIYNTLFKTNSLYAIGTTYMRMYDYTGVEDITKRRLIYGWYLYDKEEASTLLAFVPMAETDIKVSINDVRIITETQDRIVRFPYTCFDLEVHNNCVYGISENYIMCYPANAVSAQVYELPFECDSFIGITDDGCAVVTGNDGVYKLKLP